MRKFSSYGPVNPKLNYYAPRTALIDQVLTQLMSETPDEGGHYITVWGPRQVGKTWTVAQDAITTIVSVFRHIYIQRQLQVDVPTAEKSFLLHGVALIGVRAIQFKYDNQTMNFLYLNGVIDVSETTPDTFEAKFSCPFVQKRLFNYFSTDLFQTIDRLHDPFADLSDTITADRLNIKNLLGLYESYIQHNRNWLFRDEAPPSNRSSHL